MIYYKKTLKGIIGNFRQLSEHCKVSVSASYPHGLRVMIAGFHPADPGSSPGGDFYFIFCDAFSSFFWFHMGRSLVSGSKSSHGGLCTTCRSMLLGFFIS